MTQLSQATQELLASLPPDQLKQLVATLQAANAATQQVQVINLANLPQTNAMCTGCGASINAAVGCPTCGTAYGNGSGSGSPPPNSSGSATCQDRGNMLDQNGDCNTLNCPSSIGYGNSTAQPGPVQMRCTQCGGVISMGGGPCPTCNPQPAPTQLPDEQLSWSFTKDDLTQLLDLDAKEGRQGEIVEMGESGGLGYKPVEGKPPSDTALATDKWTLRRGKELKNSELNGIDPATGVGLPKADEFELADAYAASYEIDPKIAKEFATAQAKLRAQWYDSILKSDDFQASRQLTIGDINMAEIGAESIIESWLEYKATITAKQQQQAVEEGLVGTGGGGDITSQINLKSSAAKAAAKASQHIHEAHGGGEGVGLNGQCDGGRKNPEATKKLFNLMKRGKQFRKIMEIAGKMRSVLYAKQGAKLVRGAEEVVDIHLGGNIRHILPSELAKLEGPMKPLILHKILSGKALSRKKASIRPIAKGPVVLYLDESGSMGASADPKDPDYTRIAAGKAMALTMARLAMMQNRWAMLVGFSDDHEGNVCVLEPGKWDTEKLMEWVQHFYCGGTTLDCALVRGPFGYVGTDDNGQPMNVKSYWEEYKIPKGKTDIILISDGLVNVAPDVVERFNAWKKEENVKLYSIMIDSDASPIKDVSDSVYTVHGLGVMSDAVQDLCSI